MKNLKIITIPVTPLEQNCSLLIDSDTNKGILVDPGGDAEKILAVVKQNRVSIEEIWLTHSHFDHCGGVAACMAKWPDVPLLGHASEKIFRAKASEQAAMWGLTGISACPEPSRYIQGGETLNVGGIPCKVLFVPGHSPGHLAFYFEGANALIAGDTLFQGSIGRTDLPLGNHDLLINSIKREILSLPDNVLVYPGHGPGTTVGIERRSNPYILN